MFLFLAWHQPNPVLSSNPSEQRIGLSLVSCTLYSVVCPGLAAPNCPQSAQKRQSWSWSLGNCPIPPHPLLPAHPPPATHTQDAPSKVPACSQAAPSPSAPPFCTNHTAPHHSNSLCVVQQKPVTSLYTLQRRAVF